MRLIFIGIALMMITACMGNKPTETGGFFKKIISPETYHIYRADVPQGNAINKQKIDRLKLGMKKNQVSYLLGTPVVHNVFRQDRWDYVHYVHKNNRAENLQRVTLYFAGDQLVRIVRYRAKSNGELQKETLIKEFP